MEAEQTYVCSEKDISLRLSQSPLLPFISRYSLYHSHLEKESNADSKTTTTTNEK
jgi:hypothetical protein